MFEAKMDVNTEAMDTPPDQVVQRLFQFRAMYNPQLDLRGRPLIVGRVGMVQKNV